MIPKTIHYCWFGGKPKPPLVTKCIESWKKTCPDFEIKEWNEDNFSVDNFPFTKRMYREKKWAFVADYARLHIINQYGGFYLDTDMLLLQSLSPLVNKQCVLGEESEGVINVAMMGAKTHHPFIAACKKFYDQDPQELTTIPRVVSETYATYEDKDSVTIYPPKAFYPYDVAHISEYYGQPLGPEVIGVHLWDYSWGHPLLRFLNKYPAYHSCKKILGALGIKNTIKKMLGLAKT